MLNKKKADEAKSARRARRGFGAEKAVALLLAVFMILCAAGFAPFRADADGEGSGGSGGSGGIGETPADYDQAATLNAMVIWKPAGAKLPDGKMPVVTFEVYADGEYVEGKDLSFTDSSTFVAWTASVPDHLPLYKIDGETYKRINYTFKEKPIEGFQSGKISISTYDGTDEYGPGISISVTNVSESYLHSKKDITVSAAWSDGNPDGKTADVELIADGEQTGKTLTLTKDKTSDAFSGLNVFHTEGDNFGEGIVYSIIAASDGYVAYVLPSAENEDEFSVKFLPEDRFFIPVSLEWYLSSEERIPLTSTEVLTTRP